MKSCSRRPRPWPRQRNGTSNTCAASFAVSSDTVVIGIAAELAHDHRADSAAQAVRRRRTRRVQKCAPASSLCSVVRRRPCAARSCARPACARPRVSSAARRTPHTACFAAHNPRRYSNPAEPGPRRQFGTATPRAPGRMAKSPPASGWSASSCGARRCVAVVTNKTSSSGPPNAQLVGRCTGSSTTRSMRPSGANLVIRQPSYSAHHR